MGPQAEVRPVGTNPDLQRLREGCVGLEGRGRGLRVLSLGPETGLGPEIGCQERGGRGVARSLKMGGVLRNPDRGRAGGGSWACGGRVGGGSAGWGLGEP